MATETLAEPNMLPTTVGMVEKNPPFAAPLMMTNATRGATVLDTGHSTSMLNAPRRSDRKSVLSGPSRSPRKPNPSRRGEVEGCDQASAGARGEAQGCAVERKEKGRDEKGEGSHGAGDEEHHKLEAAEERPA
jgi:hypothetical protein